MRYFVIALLLGLLLLFASLRPAKEEPVTISLVQLLANPEKFDRKTVTVGGYLLMEH